MDQIKFCHKSVYTCVATSTLLQPFGLGYEELHTAVGAVHTST